MVVPAAFVIAVVTSGLYSACGTQSSGSSCLSGPNPPIRIGPPARLDALAAKVAHRVERLRGLRFRYVPDVVVVSRAQFSHLAGLLAHDARLPGAERAHRREFRRRARAVRGFYELAGLLSRQPGPRLSAAVDGNSAAYDYVHHRVVLVRDAFPSREQLTLTLAHEFTHALEDQRFHLRLRTLGVPGEAAEARRATIEGTATYVAGLYRRRYFADAVPLAYRLSSGAVSSASGTRIIDDLVSLDYGDAPLFIRRLHLRGGWKLVDAALRHPPTRSDQIYHPVRWPPVAGGRRAAPEVGGPRGSAWRQVGSAPAGEDVARFTLSVAGRVDGAATKGWIGGRLAAWRRPGSRCEGACRAASAAVATFRWRRPSDATGFDRAIGDYVIAGLYGAMVSPGVWRVGDGFVATARAGASTTLAFAPSARLARALASR